MARNLLVQSDDVDMRGQLKQPFEGLAGIQVPGNLVELQLVELQRLMGNLFENRFAGLIICTESAAFHKPGQRIIFTEPVAIIFSQNKCHQIGGRSQIHRHLRAFAEMHESFDHPLDRLPAVDQMQKRGLVILVEFDQTQKKLVERPHETSQLCTVKL